MAMTALYDGTQAGNAMYDVKGFAFWRQFVPYYAADYAAAFADYAVEATRDRDQRPYITQLQFWMWGEE
jgi:hypothetical protein